MALKVQNGLVHLTYNGIGPISKQALGFVLGFLSLKGDLQTLYGGGEGEKIHSA